MHTFLMMVLWRCERIRSEMGAKSYRRYKQHELCPLTEVAQQVGFWHKEKIF